MRSRPCITASDALILYPLSDLNPQKVQELAQNKSGCLIICGSGRRAMRAAEKLQNLLSVTILEGGIQAWEKADLPLVRGRKMISLERQVRIAAGAIVLTGVLLAIFVNHYFVGLSAFVGAGLVFAGITDTCGMAMLLARMPWNTRGT